VQVDGRPALAFWQRGKGGAYQLLDEHYRPIGRIRAGHGHATNLHELVVTPGGDAWVSSDVKRRGIIEYVVQRVDLATGKVRFEWRSLNHVKPSDSYKRRPRGGNPWDYFHGNAIAPPTAADPTVVISSRITEIGPDGRVDLLLKLQRWSYRALPAQWTGRPAGAPRIAAHRRRGLVDVWASWNGATQISRWRIVAGGQPAATVPFADLETKATVRTNASQVA